MRKLPKCVEEIKTFLLGIGDLTAREIADTFPQINEKRIKLGTNPAHALSVLFEFIADEFDLDSSDVRNDFYNNQHPLKELQEKMTKINGETFSEY